MPWCLFLGGFNTISWKSQADVQSFFSTRCSEAWVCLTGICFNVFFHTQTCRCWKHFCCEYWCLSSVNTYGAKPHYHFYGCFFNKLVSQTFLEGVSTCVRRLTYSCWCLLRIVCGCWLSLAIQNSALLRYPLLLFFLPFFFFLRMIVNKCKLENNLPPNFFFFFPFLVLLLSWQDSIVSEYRRMASTLNCTAFYLLGLLVKS